MKNRKSKNNNKNEFENTTWNRKEGKAKKIKDKLKFATLNVQGINTLGRRQEIEKWMKRKNRPIMHSRNEN